MVSHNVVALNSACRAPARATLLERRLARYCRRLQPQVRQLAARHSRLADLAVSFPALLLALALPRPNFDPEPAIKAVIAGEPLSVLARAAGVALWLRKLPPEAFERAIPMLPDGDFVRVQICNHIPRSPKRLASWLSVVALAFEVGDETIAIWIASEMNRDPKAVKADRVRRVC